MIKEYIVEITDEVMPYAFERFENEYAPEQELIRCKDCKFRQSGVIRIIDGKECNLCEVVKGYKPADWFCADGKRRRW